MSTDPFKKYKEEPSYLLEGESENDSIARIDARINKLASNNSRGRMLRWLAMAAMVLVIFFTGRHFLSGNTEGVEIASVYYNAYPNYQTITTRGDDSETQLADAYMAYDQEEFELAVGIFKQATILSAADGLYYAIALQGLSKWETSLQLLFRISTELPDEYATAGEWYLALALVAQDRSEEALPVLESIASGKSVFKEQASDLLHDIQ